MLADAVLCRYVLFAGKLTPDEEQPELYTEIVS